MRSKKLRNVTQAQKLSQYEQGTEIITESLYQSIKNIKSIFHQKPISKTNNKSEQRHSLFLK